MTLPSRGKRTITVDGNDYHWLIRSRATYIQECESGNMLAAIERADTKGATLAVVFPWVRFEGEYKFEARSVTPGIIAKCIREALREGWQPAMRGTRFLFHYPDRTN